MPRAMSLKGGIVFSTHGLETPGQMRGEANDGLRHNGSARVNGRGR